VTVCRHGDLAWGLGGGLGYCRWFVGSGMMGLNRDGLTIFN